MLSGTFLVSAMLSADLTPFGCHVFPINDQMTSQSEFSVTSTTLGNYIDDLSLKRTYEIFSQ